MARSGSQTGIQRRWIKDRVYGYYRNSRLDEADRERKAGNLTAALDAYYVVAFLDENGPINSWLGIDKRPIPGTGRFDPELAIRASGVLRAIAKSMNYLGLSLEAGHERFIISAGCEAKMLRFCGLKISPTEAWSRLLPTLRAVVETGTRWRVR